MRSVAVVLLALSTAAGFVPAAQAADCGALTRALSLDLTPGPAGGPLLGVAVTINGTPRNFLLDTDGQVSRVSRAIVTQLGLSPRSQGKLLALNGAVINSYVVTVDLGVGSAMLKNNEMLVQENPGRFDGLFAPDLMQHYDIDLDFAGRKLNYFLTDHCDGKVAYWVNSGITSVDLRGWTEHANYPEPTIPVSIDGHEVLAVINTGNANTTLDADTAHQLFDLTADSAGTVPMGTMNGNASQRVYGYTFKTLAIGGLTISSPRITILPDLMGKQGTDTVRADSRIVRYTDHRLPTVRLGMDMLRRLHVYIAAKENKVYLTLAADQGQGAAPGVAASAPPAK
jgi:predicted aspartyl protease